MLIHPGLKLCSLPEGQFTRTALSMYLRPGSRNLCAWGGRRSIRAKHEPTGTQLGAEGIQLPAIERATARPCEFLFCDSIQRQNDREFG